MNMKLSRAGRRFIQSWERCRLKAYKNSATEPWTIGWGNTYYPKGFRGLKRLTAVKKGDVITQAEADALFDVVVRQFEADVNTLVKQPLTQGMYDALVSFAYNCGSDIDLDLIPEGLGDSTLLKLVNRNPHDPNIGREFTKWIAKGSIFEQGLLRRRQAEVHLYYSVPNTLA